MQKKKSLGQHFLHSASYLNAVADAADIQQGETVLEVGPGEGTLTEVLLARGAKVIAVEKDSRLISFLQNKFAGKNFEVTEGDALDFEISKYRNIDHYAVVGNIPYYISGAFIKKAFGQKRKMLRTTIGIDSSERPEDLPLATWLDLSRVSVS